MPTKRVSLAGFALTASLLGAVAPAAAAGAQTRPATILRCEADFAGFVVGTAAETIEPSCADLGPAYQAGVAAYQSRNAECATIRALSHPIRRAECEARARWEAERAFRSTAETLRATAEPTPTAPTPTAPPIEPAEPVEEAGDGTSALADGVDAVSRTIEEHPNAALAAGAAAATLAFPATRAATFAAGRSIPTFFTKLLDAVKVPFAAIGTALR